MGWRKRLQESQPLLGGRHPFYGVLKTQSGLRLGSKGVWTIRVDSPQKACCVHGRDKSPAAKCCWATRPGLFRCSQISFFFNFWFSTNYHQTLQAEKNKKQNTINNNIPNTNTNYNDLTTSNTKRNRVAGNHPFRGMNPCSVCSLMVPQRDNLRLCHGPQLQNRIMALGVCWKVVRDNRNKRASQSECGKLNEQRACRFI